MPLLKSPMMSADARGSIGGITFSKSYAGPVCKEKPFPPRRMRTTMPANRSRFGFLSRYWGELTDAQRESWRVWALNHPGINKFGDPFIMSGANAHTMLNHNAMRIHGPGARQDLPPPDPPPASLNTLTVATGVGNPGEIDLTWTHNGTGDAGDYNEIWIAGPFQSPGRVEVHNQFAWSQSVAGNILLDTIADLDEGFWYWVKVRYIGSRGQVTAWLTGQATPMLTP